MKPQTVVAPPILLFFLAAGGPVGAQEATRVPDSASLLAYVQEYQRTWNTRDAAAVAAFFTEDADMVMGNGPAAHGRAEIAASWGTYFDVQEDGRRGRFDVTSSRLLAPDVALIDLTSTTGAPGSDDLVTRKARGTWLVRREAGSWRIAAMRGMPMEEDEVELIPSLDDAERLRPGIRAFVRAYEDAFNRHDPDAVAAFFTRDADYVVRDSPVVRGDRAIRDWWAAYFSEPRPYRALMLIDEIRMVSADVALVIVTATGAVPGASEELEPVRTARGTWILVRENGEWRLGALRVLPSQSDRLVRASSR